MQLAVLLYHGMNIHGDSYGDNDHVAFERDLVHLVDNGFKIIPAALLVDFLRGKSVPKYLRGKKAVVITCDDGSDYDYVDLVHETCGAQYSFFSIMQHVWRKNKGLFSAFSKYVRPHMTSFVIASPWARQVLDKTCMVGKGRWNDSWWDEAVASGYMHIGNHSWDHLSETLPYVSQREQVKGSFLTIDSWDDACAQVEQAERYIRALAPNPADRLFAYPYGHVSPFLRNEYFPAEANAKDMGVTAAFSTEPEYVTLQTNIFDIPRFVCGADWRSIEEFVDIVGQSRI